MAAVKDTIRDQGFEPLESSIPMELTIAEYRTRRVVELPSRPERRAPRRRLRALIRR